MRGLAQRLRDRVAGSIAHLQQSLARGTSTASEPVPTVLAGELDAELLEPVDRRRRLGREDLDEPAVGGLVARRPHVLSVLLRRVVLPEGGLDAALRLRGVAGLERPLRRESDPCAGTGCRHRRCEAGGAAADHKHVKRHGTGHRRANLPHQNL